MKIPKYFRQPATMVCHPRMTIREVVRALEIEYRLFRKNGWTPTELRALKSATSSLRTVAEGQPWDIAFDWPKEPPK